MTDGLIRAISMSNYLPVRLWHESRTPRTPRHLEHLGHHGHAGHPGHPL